MVEFLQNNQIAIRQLILYECLGRVPVFYAYQKLRKRIGEIAMDYQEFEFWYMRFANQKYDLESDRRLEPKTRQFSDLPLDIVDKIVDKVKLKQRLVIRKVSKNLRTFIENRDPGFKNIFIRISGQSIHLDYDKPFTGIKYGEHCQLENYSQEKENRENWVDWREYWSDVNEKHIQRKLVKNENYKELALHDLGIVLDNSKLQLGFLEVRVTFDFSEEFDMKLASKCVQYSKNRTLKKFFVDLEQPREELEPDEMKIRMDEILKELKNVEKIKFSTLVDDISWIPIESFAQCTRFSFNCFTEFKESHMLRFREVLLKSTVLECFTLSSMADLDTDELVRQLVPDSVVVSDSPRPKIRHFSMPESGKLFEIKTDYDWIRVERKH